MTVFSFGNTFLLCLTRALLNNTMRGEVRAETRIEEILGIIYFYDLDVGFELVLNHDMEGLEYLFGL